MPRTKRGQRLATTVKEKPVAERPVVEYRQALCPVCGRAAGYYRPGGYKEDKFGLTKPVNFWERTRDFDPDKPFGVIFDMSQGRGRGMQTIGYFSPDEDVDGYFPAIKARLLRVLQEWVKKKWITLEEIKDLFRES